MVTLRQRLFLTVKFSHSSRYLSILQNIGRRSDKVDRRTLTHTLPLAIIMLQRNSFLPRCSSHLYGVQRNCREEAIPLGLPVCPFLAFSPMMSINTSGTCATTRLTQCRDFGVYMNDVTRKFERDPEYATDLMSRWSEETKAEWPPILYLYERDWGHLVFTDLTTTRFLLVMIFPNECDCGNFSHHDYGALTKFQADRFMSLLKYLYHTEQKPNWFAFTHLTRMVRATFVTQSNGYTLDPMFLGTLEPPPSDVRNIFHVTSQTFIPSLLSNELESIDTLLKQSNKRVPKTVRYEVLGSKDSRPDVSAVWKSKNSRQCAHCQKSSTSDLQLCSRCRLIHYCSRECQRSAWPMHKLVCNKA
ncbi:hypothetical protein C8F04DRAFT_1208237 [Mycena alexandri]|uniref:MYND-type domain-containing protein n=1 Tax=Mycena alexandri TaxID=1745969 RepID=A0AAD6T9Q6_9AGAR|nr:hypothetical protein C8F04DRAFT_1208237 [Mycena alexandri]